jgi:chromate transport protein ChrA
MKKGGRVSKVSKGMNLKLNNVPLGVDILTAVLAVGLVALMTSKVKVPEEAKLAFLLALIILISCYSVEAGIVVVIVAIVYVLVSDGIKKKNNENKNN